jgi:hypothetical protein
MQINLPQIMKALISQEVSDQRSQTALQLASPDTQQVPQNERKIKENKGFCCHLIWNHPYKNLNQGQ